MLAEADVVHVVGGRVADDVCQSSARVESSVREERRGAPVSSFLLITKVSKNRNNPNSCVSVPSPPFKSNQLFVYLNQCL